MPTITAPVRADWRQEFFEIEDATFLNTATQGVMPKASFRAVQAALEWKKFPHRMPEDIYFALPNRIRALLARLLKARPEEFALTTGASGGMAAIAYGIAWKPGDEILIAAGEFPMQYTTWKPMEAREGIKLKVIAPREQFISADDFIGALTPRTRLVSASLVRFDDGAMFDAARVAAACHAQGALLLLDLSQCCGAMPMDVASLGADFLVCASYKWLLGPYGTGFFWAKSEHLANIRPSPFYWMAVEGAENFHSLPLNDLKPSGARRWDAAETGNFLNLSALEASLEFILQMGPETVAAHARRLIEMMYERLPKDRCVPASPLHAAQRGPYGCFAGRSPEKSAALFERLCGEKVIVGLREGKVRVSPHVYNSERDIDKLIEVITA